MCVYMYIYVCVLTYIYTSADKQLNVINCIQKKSFCLHNVCVCVYFLCIYKCTYSMYFENIYIYVQYLTEVSTPLTFL